MNVDLYFTLTQPIAHNPKLSAQEKALKQKLIRHLCYFAHCFSTSKLKIDTFTHQNIGIVQHLGQPYGVYFHDLALEQQHQETEWQNIISQLQQIKAQNQLKSLWYVFVDEGQLTAPLQSFDWLKRHHLSAYFERIYAFNFSKSTILPLI